MNEPEESPPEPGGNDGPLRILKRIVRAAEKKLSNLQLAIAELAILAFLSGVGTIVDQEQVSSTVMCKRPIECEGTHRRLLK
jgi:hypothetical protein